MERCRTPRKGRGTFKGVQGQARSERLHGWRGGGAGYGRRGWYAEPCGPRSRRST